MSVQRYKGRYGGWLATALVSVVAVLCLGRYGLFLPVAMCVILPLRTAWRRHRLAAHLITESCKLQRCMQAVHRRAQDHGYAFRPMIHLYVFADDRVQVLPLGARSIAVSRGALQLDSQTLQALLACSYGHLFYGTQVWSTAVAVALAFGMGALFFWNWVVGACLAAGLLLFGIVGACRLHWLPSLLAGRSVSHLRRFGRGLRTLVWQGGQRVYTRLTVGCMAHAERLAHMLGYGFALERYRSRFGDSADPFWQDQVQPQMPGAHRPPGGGVS